MGLSNKIKEKFEKVDAVDNASKTEFGDQKDFFKYVDEYINMGCKDTTILNTLKELYKDQSKVEEINTSPDCSIECTSEPDGKYSLTPEEVQLLGEINKHPKNSESRILGLKIEKLYKTTKIILCDGPNTPDSNSDLLGSYSHEGQSPSLIPVIRLYMDRITEASRLLYCNRKYITASVYIHEMMHRFYDVRPDLGWKEYIKEIEEPMAVFGAMKFCEEFGNGSLLKVSRSLTEELQKSKWYNPYHYVYILGLEMFVDKSVDARLIETYRHVSLMMHKESEVEEFVNPISSYLDICKQNKDSLANLVKPIQIIINKFAEFFPLDKGTE